ncbi:MAG: D-serine dehydratase, partial [Vibrio fluvialis]
MTEALIERFPLLKQLIALQETQWFNPNITTLAEGLPHVGLSEQDVQDAAARLRRFAPYIEHVFPETAVNQGIIESPLVTIDHMRRALQSHYQTDMPGKLLLKLDSHLPISGSIKAR